MAVTHAHHIFMATKDSYHDNGDYLR